MRSQSPPCTGTALLCGWVNVDEHHVGVSQSTLTFPTSLLRGKATMTYGATPLEILECRAQKVGRTSQTLQTHWCNHPQGCLYNVLGLYLPRCDGSEEDTALGW